MIIAKAGRFTLNTKTIISYPGSGKHIYKTNEIEICAWQENNTCYTIADFNNEGELVSCGDRLLEAIKDIEELDDIKALAKIGNLICSLPPVESGHKDSIDEIF